MNERLKELAEQALDYAAIELATVNIGGQIEFNRLYSEKFAELIVKECLNQCRQEWYDTNNDPVINANKDPRMIGIKIGINQGAIRCLDRIKKRFGVGDE